MKFGKQIRFVAVKSWYDKYVEYKKFKVAVTNGRERMLEAHENGALDSELDTMKEEFLENIFKLIYKSLNSVTSFYTTEYVKFQELINEIEDDIDVHLPFSQRDEESKKSFIKRVFGITI
ncbi:hypothetical protein TVAG_245570 [Trichomonas vaginalis G3]|uniref:SPX domain-containing protein n=1 Tax=Trichomonas vaginalis (strain ATCC PRA-98 / G3) TaxID=412133 RepID=A2G7A3_TRIV3|nr:hypothetical protein TVAG_245570 [Trichomonas vaginalis G3]|eukprot:XP_001299895.1 hypothetical protein [Trichomonas vaginalis G3]